MTSQWEAGGRRGARVRRRGAGVGGAATWLRLSAASRRPLLPLLARVRESGTMHSEALMEAEYSEVVASCEARRDAPMEATLDTMHPLDPPPPDVLLALLARNKALEVRRGVWWGMVWRLGERCNQEEYRRPLAQAAHRTTATPPRAPRPARLSPL
ncbi:unnamed protein product [Spodoptera exigua]|nr:unnamed protein product [Spodoptera exigua]